MNKNWTYLLGLLALTFATESHAGLADQLKCTLRCQKQFPPIPIVPEPPGVPPNATCTQMNPGYPACLGICSAMATGGHAWNVLGCQAAVDARCAAAGAGRKNCIEAGYAICNVLF